MKLTKSRLRRIVREEIRRIDELGVTENFLEDVADVLQRQTRMSAQVDTNGYGDLIFVDQKFKVAFTFMPGGSSSSARYHIVVETKDGDFVGKGPISSSGSVEDVAQKIIQITK